MMMFVLPFHPACQRAPGTIGGPVDCNIEIGLCILSRDIHNAWNRYLDMTALISTV